MLIRQKRVQKVDKHLGIVERGTMLILGVGRLDRFTDELKRAGFTNGLTAGDAVLPTSAFGPVSRFNAEGRYRKHKDQPKETAYRTVEWHWIEWRGRYDTEEMSGWRDLSYKRYPRTFLSPPSVELRIAISVHGESIVVADPIEYSEKNFDRIRHIVNLFLEIFGECQIFYEELGEIVHVPLKRLNWRVLPPGEYPWERLEKHVKSIIEKAPGGNQPVIEDRFRTINDYHPEFHAIGEAGFLGYVIFGFPNKGLFVLESIYTGNATYVFGERWEELSKMTKADILCEHLQRDRVIHLRGWHQQIEELLGANNST